MKKKTTIIVIIALLIILLIPIPMHLKDGGTVEYKALLYKVSKVHRLTGNIEKKCMKKGLRLKYWAWKSLMM